MSTEITIAPVLVDKIPEFAKELYPRFVQFMRDYIDFLEQDENFLRIILDWNHNTDPLNKVEPYIDAMLKDLGFESGQNLAVDKNLIMHLLRDFYLSRGSEASFKFLFRALFNEDVELRYPRDRLLIPSYATYGERHFIFTTANNRDTEQFQSILEHVRMNGGTVRGLASGVTAAIENILIQHGSGTPYLRIEILLPTLEFEISEGVIIQGGTASVAEVVKPILDIQIVEPGYGYSEYDLVSVTGPKLQGNIRVESVSKGGITDLEFHIGGWRIGDSIRAFEGDGFGFMAYVTSTGAGGSVTGYKLVNKGYNYSFIPPLTDTNLLKISGLRVRGLSTEIGGIKKLNIISPYVDFEDCEFTIASTTGTGAVLAPMLKTRWSVHSWEDRKGFIGENSTLIDSDKYQQYSYTIVSSISSSNYDNFVTELLHPAGYIKTNSYEITSHLALDLGTSTNVVGGSVGYIFDSELNLTFTSEFDIDNIVTLVTDTGDALVTDNGIEFVISE